MRAALLAATMMCGLATGAHAAVFDLTGQVYNAEALSRNAAVQFDLVISDAAVTRGSFNLMETATSQVQTITGDVADFVSASTGPVRASGQTITPTSASNANLTIVLTFSGGLPSGSITFNGTSDGIQLAGIAGAFSGLFGSDFNNCPNTGPNACAVTGQLTASASANSVPEPISMSLLGIGLMGLAAARRRPAI